MGEFDDCWADEDDFERGGLFYDGPVKFQDICPYCGSKLQIRSSLVVYRQDFGFLLICSAYPKCDAYVGCHGRTKTPKGTVANAELRAWRKQAHGLFDPLWKSRKMQRNQAYIWLAGKLDISVRTCHIAMFNVDMCRRAVEILTERNRPKLAF